MQHGAQRLLHLRRGSGSCRHVKGETYGTKLCFTQLEEPQDAYEWSFVAVPAQREAGVLKRFGRDSDDMAKLRRKAELGKRYLKELRREVVRLAMLADDGLDGGMFAKAAQRLEESELREVSRPRGPGGEPVPGGAAAAARSLPAGEDETVFLV